MGARNPMGTFYVPQYPSIQDGAHPSAPSTTKLQRILNDIGAEWFHDGPYYTCRIERGDVETAIQLLRENHVPAGTNPMRMTL